MLKETQRASMGLAETKNIDIKTSAEVNKIMALLHEYAGFRTSSYLANKLQTVFRNASSAELQDWIVLMEQDTSKNDLVSLVEDLCNHETYFFRDKEQLGLLSEYIFPELIKTKKKQGRYDFSIWSAACSTGEEPYTLAMMLITELLKHGIAYTSGSSEEIILQPGCTIEVLGTDISRQAIRIAKEATYQLQGLGSFRQFPNEYLKFFSSINSTKENNSVLPSSYRKLNESVKKLVNFKLFNLMSYTPPRHDFDLVLCRNVLIYIDQLKQKNIQTMLSKSLSTGAYLMFSPVDTFYCSDICASRHVGDWVLYEKK